MTAWEHKKHGEMKYSGIASILVVSDSLSGMDECDWRLIDKSGAFIKEYLEAKGVQIADFDVVPDDIDRIKAWVLNQVKRGVGLLVLTGGTGFSSRDVTPEAVMPLLDVEIPGFGEEFRRISIRKIGGRGMLSRAFAGIINQTILVALPGSPKAVKDGLELFFPVVGHLRYLRSKT